MKNFGVQNWEKKCSQIRKLKLGTEGFEIMLQSLQRCFQNKKKWDNIFVGMYVTTRLYEKLCN